MTGLSMIPEVDQSQYNPYARHVHTRKHRKGPALKKLGADHKAEADSKNGVLHKQKVIKRQPKPDYYGLSNSMMKLTVSKGPRKWRPKDSSEPKYAWQTTPRQIERQRQRHRPDADDDDDKASVMSLDGHILRKSRSSTYTKYKYPEKYHYGVRTSHSHLEIKIPQCLRQYPGYCNQPMRQDCKYNPDRSVTHLNIHSVRSGNLPHPSPDGSVVKRRRPTSAPPGTMTSYTKRASSGSLGSSTRSKTGSNVGREHERNGSYQYSYDDDIEEEEEGPSHVTLEVEDSDDEYEAEDESSYQRPTTSLGPRDRAQASSGTASPVPEVEEDFEPSYSATSELKFDPNSDNVDSEELEIRDDTRRYSGAEIVSSDQEDIGPANDTFSVADSDSAQSVDYEPDFS